MTANTTSEAVPAQPPAQAEPVSETTSTSAPANPTPKKHGNVQKTIGSKAKAFLDFFQTAGEHIRGNINAALDGAGDAIAGRKSGEVTSRSADHSRRSAPPLPARNSTSSPSALTTADASAPAPAPAPTSAPVSTPAPEPTASTPDNNAESEAENGEETENKRFPVGKFVNNSLKRTITLVTRVGGTLRSKSTQTAGSIGNSFSQGKQRASRRFSRGPKSTPNATEASASNQPSSAPNNTPETVATTNTTSAETN